MLFLKEGNQYYKVLVRGDGDGMAKGIPQESYFVVEASSPEQAKREAEKQMEKTYKIVKGSAKASTVVLNSNSFQNGVARARQEIANKMGGRFVNASVEKGYTGGKKAAVDGLPRTYNPHISKMDKDREEWFRGWEEGMKEQREKGRTIGGWA